MATKYGEIKVQTPSGVVGLPVYNAGSSGSSVYEALKVQTPSGVGYIPLADPSKVAYPYIKVQTASGVLAVHDSTSTYSGTLIDDFEDGDKSEYNNARNGSLFSVTSSSSYNGTYGLEGDSTTGSTRIFSTSGLNAYPSAGDTIELYSKAFNGARKYFYFGQQSESQRYGYRVNLRVGENYAEIARFDSGSKNSLVTGNSTLSNNTWYRWRIDWGSSGSIRFRAFDESNNTVVDLSANDTTYTSGGIGWGHDDGSAYFDYCRIP